MLFNRRRRTAVQHRTYVCIGRVAGLSVDTAGAGERRYLVHPLWECCANDRRRRNMAYVLFVCARMVTRGVFSSGCKVWVKASRKSSDRMNPARNVRAWRDERDEPVRVDLSTGAAGGRRGSQLLDGPLQAGAVPAAESQLHRVLESADRAAHADRDQLSASCVPRLPRRSQKVETVMRLVQGLRKVCGERAVADIVAVLQETMRVFNQHQHLPHPAAVCHICQQCHHQRSTVHYWCHKSHGAYPGRRGFQRWV